MNIILHRIQQFFRYYFTADTIYRIHSPFVFELSKAVLEDERNFYAFRDVEAVRAAMKSSAATIEITDFGAGTGGTHQNAEGVKVHQRQALLADVVQVAGSSVRQSRRLFRLTNFLQPKNMVELGTSVGVGAMYLASAARDARFISLEGCQNCAEVARVNLDILSLKNAEVVTGAFENTLVPVLENVKLPDIIFFDGNHRQEPTLRYFEICLRYAHEHSVFIFDDIYWSEGMTAAWTEIKNNPQVTATVDFFDFGIAIFSKKFKVKQHFRIVPASYKIWQKFI